MFWFRRPPLARPLGAALILVVAVLVEFGGPAPTSYPFTAVALAPGDPVVDVEWREAPGAFMPVPDLEGAFAAHRLDAGDPLVPSSLAYGEAVPAGWWAMAVEIPAAAAPGTRVQLVSIDPPDLVPGIVVEPAVPDAFGLGGLVALVAVPAERAGTLAAAVASGRVVTLIEPS